MGSVTMTKDIPLSVPIMISGIETSHLTMRRPKVRDQMTHHVGGAMTPEATARMYADLMSISYDEVMEIDLLDYETVGDVYDSFLHKTATPVSMTSETS